MLYSCAEMRGNTRLYHQLAEVSFYMYGYDTPRPFEISPKSLAELREAILKPEYLECSFRWCIRFECAAGSNSHGMIVEDVNKLRERGLRPCSKCFPHIKSTTFHKKKDGGLVYEDNIITNEPEGSDSYARRFLRTLWQ